MKAEDNQFPYVTLAEGAAPATPGAGLVRAYVDATDGRLYLVDEAGVAHPVAFTTDPATAGALGDLTDVDTTGALAGQILGTADGATWGPVDPSAGSGGGDPTLDLTVVTVTQTTSGTASFQNIPNAAVTFTAPSTGTVVIEASGGATVQPASSLELNLRAGGADVAGSGQRVLRPSGTDMQGRWTYRHVLTGLTPDASLTYNLGMRRGDGSGIVTIEVGTSVPWGQLVMSAKSSIAP